jgi:uncharacterized protein YceK
VKIKPEWLHDWRPRIVCGVDIPGSFVAVTDIPPYSIVARIDFPQGVLESVG